MKKLDKADILNLLRQVAVLLSSGLTLLRSLELLRHAAAKEGLRQLISQWLLQLQAGKQFSQCLESYPHYFDPFCRLLIRIGEQTGELDHMLNRFICREEKNREQKAKIKEALFYPAIVSATALLTSLIMLVFVVPHFALFFSQAPEKIPAFTKAVIALSTFVREQGLGMLTVCCLIGLASFFSSPFSQGLPAFFMRLPYLGSLTKKIILMHFVQNLSTLLAAAIPLSIGLKTLAPLSTIPTLRLSILKLHHEIHAGRQLHSALYLDPFFPTLLIQLVKTGEDSGTLDLMLEKFAALYLAEIEQRFSQFHRLFEPLLITILGALIGGLVIAMYLPIFHLGTAI